MSEDQPIPVEELGQKGSSLAPKMLPVLRGQPVPQEEHLSSWHTNPHGESPIRYIKGTPVSQEEHLSSWHTNPHGESPIRYIKGTPTQKGKTAPQEN